MKVEDAIQMMSVLEASYDGTLKSAERIMRLNLILLEDPERFWDSFWEEFNAGSPMRAKAEELYHKFGPDMTFADLERKDGDDR